jgi:hypothetical protein
VCGHVAKYCPPVMSARHVTMHTHLMCMHAHCHKSSAGWHRIARQPRCMAHKRYNVGDGGMAWHGMVIALQLHCMAVLAVPRNDWCGDGVGWCACLNLQHDAQLAQLHVRSDAIQ